MSNGMTTDVKEALKLAANRLDRLVLNAVPNSREWFEIKEWAEEARRALSSPGDAVREALKRAVDGYRNGDMAAAHVVAAVAKALDYPITGAQFTEPREDCSCCVCLHARAALSSRPAAMGREARDAIIEECAAVLDEAAQDWNRIRDPGMANNARSYAKKIRGLKAVRLPT